MRSIRYAEGRVSREAKLLNKELPKGIQNAAKNLRLPQYLDEFAVRLSQTFIQVVTYGYGIGKLSLKKELKLSLERPLREMMSAEEEQAIKVFFEFESERISQNLRHNLGQVAFKWLDVVNTQGYSEKQSALVLRLGLREAGYSPQTARNVANVFTTGFHAAFNGVRYKDTVNNPDIWGYRYVTAADEKVRENHAAQHGVTLATNDPFWTIWLPPNGYNCRCRIELVEDPVAPVYPDTSVQPDPGFERNLFQSFGG